MPVLSFRRKPANLLLLLTKTPDTRTKDCNPRQVHALDHLAGEFYSWKWLKNKEIEIYANSRSGQGI